MAVRVAATLSVPHELLNKEEGKEASQNRQPNPCLANRVAMPMRVAIAVTVAVFMTVLMGVLMAMTLLMTIVVMGTVTMVVVSQGMGKYV